MRKVRAVYKLNNYQDSMKKKENIMRIAAYYTCMFSLYEIDKYKKLNDYFIVLKVQKLIE